MGHGRVRDQMTSLVGLEEQQQLMGVESVHNQISRPVVALKLQPCSIAVMETGHGQDIRAGSFW